MAAGAAEEAVCQVLLGMAHQGFVAAEWLNLGNGGAGGGGGSMVPFKKVAVTPTETLSVIVVGKGGNGGAAGNITNSITTYKQGLNGEHSYQSYLKRGNTTLIKVQAAIAHLQIFAAAGAAED